ncbi:hypothetical protein D3C80_1164110 [compost metagenome]
MFAGSGRLVSDACGRIHRRAGGAVVVTPGGHAASDGVVPHPRIPYRFHCAIVQCGGFTVRKLHIKLVVQLAVGKGHRVQPGGGVDPGSEPNAVFGENALDKLQVGLPPLSDQFTYRVGPFQPKLKV